jgi:hypothetical protein
MSHEDFFAHAEYTLNSNLLTEQIAV